jgi:hypothetical protein
MNETEQERIGKAIDADSRTRYAALRVIWVVRTPSSARQ